MYLTAALPRGAFFSAIEHGRMHHGTPEQRAREWSRLKAQGVAAGLADIFIWVGGRFIAIELKAGDNTTSEGQEVFARAMQANGFACHTVRSVAALHDILAAAGVPVQPQHRQIAEGHDASLAQILVPKKKRAPRPARPKLSRKGLAFGRAFYGLKP
jgi:hypothetical protein